MLNITHTAAVADLAWAINSPNLLKPAAWVWNLPRIKNAQVDAACLLNSLRGSSHRVGVYFERLLSYYLSQTLGYQMIAEQLQIESKGRTLGEIDFLFRDRLGKVVHLEAAVKFYLCLPGAPYHGSHLIGPNPTDCFEKKLHRLTSHQLRLSERFGQATAAPVDHVDRRLAVMKGRIYYHVSTHPARHLPAPQLATNHSRGSWVHARDWSPTLFNAGARVRVLTKPFWLTPQSSSADLSCDQFGRSLEEHFSVTHRPVHACISAGAGDHYLFVVTDSWPSEHSHSHSAGSPALS